MSMEIIAHRGNSAHYPENTILSFRNAFKLNVDWIECDVRRTIDGELVIIHDSKVDRTTNGQGSVSEKTLSQIKELDAGEGEEIPTLRELFDVYNDNTGIIIEVKERGIEFDVMELIKEYDMEEKVIITSFFHDVSLNIKKTYFRVKTGIIFLCGPIRTDMMAADSLADIIFPKYEFLNSEMLKQVHESNLKLYPWVIDNKNTLEFILSLGVDGVITNHPAEIISHLKDSIYF